MMHLTSSKVNNIIDLTDRGNLLTGIKHGKATARELKFNLEPGRIYYIKIRKDQLVTSSYFIGILSIALKEILYQVDGKWFEVITTNRRNRFDLKGVMNYESKDEFRRALRRMLNEGFSWGET